MSDTCPTVLIKSDEMGSVRINASDFDHSKHELFGDAAPQASGDIGTDSGDQFSGDLEKLREDAKALGIKVHWKHSAETIQAAIDAKLGE